MDSAPLNMAHFHERRADMHLKYHRYEEATKAIEMAMHHLQDAYKKVSLAKSIEVLDTQQWEYSRKLNQIKMRKQQYERQKKYRVEAPPPAPALAEGVITASQMMSAQLAVKSIDKTVKDYDMKFTSLMGQDLLLHDKENYEPMAGVELTEQQSNAVAPLRRSLFLKYRHQQDTKKQQLTTPDRQQQSAYLPGHSRAEDDEVCRAYDFGENDEMPSLAPLELPAFDFSALTASAPSLASMAELAENFQK